MSCGNFLYKTESSRVSNSLFELSFSDLCDQNGEYILTDIAEKLPILISYPGYLSESFKYSNEDEKLLVQLEKAHIVLDEVVISPTTGISLTFFDNSSKTGRNAINVITESTMETPKDFIMDANLIVSS